MATSSAETQSSDALARLRIKRAEPRMKRSWLNRLLKMTLTTTAVLALVAIGVVLASRNGWIPAGGNWPSVPEVMQSRVEARLAVVTVESGRSAEATLVAPGYLES